MKQIKLIIVDDETLFRNGIEAIFKKSRGFHVLEALEGGNILIEKLKTITDRPDVVILDLKMTPLNGMETAKVVSDSYPEINIIILSSYYRPIYIDYMVKLGISSFLPKNIDPKELLFAVKIVHEKGIYLTQEHISMLKTDLGSELKSNFKNPDALSKREIEVLELICEELTAKEISDRLFLSKRTVEGHRNNLLSKTGAKNTAGLVVYALVNHIVDIEKKMLEYAIK